MKKFWTVLALLAVALNFSSASLWALEVQEQSASLSTITATDNKNAEDKDVALEPAVVAEETAAEVKPAVDAAKAEVPALTEEEKKVEELGDILPDTTQAEDKIS